MARIIWMLRSNSASASREKPTTVPSAKPIEPPITKPVAARSRLVPMSLISRPSWIRPQAVAATLLGAGSTWIER